MGVAPMTALLGSVVNWSAKSICQSVSVVKSGQSDPFDSGTLLMSVGGGAEGRLGILSTSL